MQCDGSQIGVKNYLQASHGHTNTTAKSLPDMFNPVPRRRNRIKVICSEHIKANINEYSKKFKQNILNLSLSTERIKLTHLYFNGVCRVELKQN